jgi:hypothetical protein
MKTTPGKSSQPAFNSAAPSRTSQRQEFEQASVPKVPPFFKEFRGKACAGATSLRHVTAGLPAARENDARSQLR